MAKTTVETDAAEADAAEADAAEAEEGLTEYTSQTGDAPGSGGKPPARRPVVTGNAQGTGRVDRGGT